NELIRMADLFRINFTLLGKPVVTSSGTKLGKVSDYAVNTDNMFIQKMYVSQSMFKNFNGGNLGVDRSQIIEINDKKVIVADLTQKMPARAGAMA
ncbi:MAG TPA: PRC-barrel domain-containing protein, partial [Verrucomicrobiae bacterium]|nr:PRC-barrel domain-containing protein [Verrucomicrobiae bacterium]